MDEIIVIGGGLAGSEAAWQIARRGGKVVLYEMRPTKGTPAHKTGNLAELVCSNSLKSKDLFNAHGLLKEELRRMGSLIIEAAEEAALPGGKALVVDREIFSRYITEKIENHPRIRVIRKEIRKIPQNGVVILATGPLTSGFLASNLQRLTGEENLAFYDAISPIVDASTLDYTKLYFKDRHGWDDDSYLNAPLDEETYYRFWQALVKAEVYAGHEFDKIPYFEGCLPIEVMAARGVDTLRFGPLRPIGLPDPKTGREPFAVVQLRPENRERTAYSLVGFQTKLRIKEQIRIFRMIPGLEKADFLRYGAVHRNTFLNAPKLLNRTLQLRKFPQLLIAGQLAGTEGYVEAAMGGLVAGINALRISRGLEPLEFPAETMTGALLKYLETADPRYFQPMNANFGLFEDAPKMKKMEKRRYLASRALEVLERWIKEAL
ncbi:MAG TPA: methylenetetrahydrofolate--tRNA-(uracil(54)-C(5))-methyltransferase (FADH(2)-oxidizing) TrmFO [candidate division WOR-3 bacterium]|uniref:Methylenetetrahydrofolate--tRNA-(uracil-5-)-methyltransferase TrmFO n=1 Tax=candidate division WOR-3 bacterium TaxID=2052148 RepID=A0A7C0X9T2_UNCW3|nr:methylenetetrahydrofolate--tRNA-(uracil(54)-C(5))-methyltransferase (FADH(2)-oxidizing) TrmFO [candidate division WOR-3 bacterium]